MALNLRHQSLAQFAARVRERYRNANRETAARIATRIMNWIDAGDLTETQVRNAFSLTAVQWSTLKTKLTNQRTAYRAVDQAVGE